MQAPARVLHPLAGPIPEIIPRVGAMKRRVVAAVVVTCVAVLVAAAAIADGVVRERTQDQLAAHLEQQVPGIDGAPEVAIGGYPFLTQVVAGRLDDVRLSATSVTVQGMRLDDVHVRLAGVSTSQPTTADTAVMDADISLTSIRSAAGTAVPADLGIEDGHLVASVTVLGLPVDVLLRPRADGRAIGVVVDSLRVAGRTIDADSLPSAVTDEVSHLSIPLTALPEGMELTSVVVGPQGAHIVASGSDVVFDAVPAA